MHVHQVLFQTKSNCYMKVQDVKLDFKNETISITTVFICFANSEAKWQYARSDILRIVLVKILVFFHMTLCRQVQTHAYLYKSYFPKGSMQVEVCISWKKWINMHVHAHMHAHHTHTHTHSVQYKNTAYTIHTTTYTVILWIITNTKNKHSL